MHAPHPAVCLVGAAEGILALAHGQLAALHERSDAVQRALGRVLDRVNDVAVVVTDEEDLPVQLSPVEARSIVRMEVPKVQKLTRLVSTRVPTAISPNFALFVSNSERTNSLHVQGKRGRRG